MPLANSWNKYEVFCASKDTQKIVLKILQSATTINHFRRNHLLETWTDKNENLIFGCWMEFFTAIENVCLGYYNKDFFLLVQHVFFFLGK